MTLGVNPSSGIANHLHSVWDNEPVAAPPAEPADEQPSTSRWSGEPFYNPFLAQLNPTGSSRVAAAGEVSFEDGVRGQQSQPIDMKLAEMCKAASDPDKPEAVPEGWDRIDATTKEGKAFLLSKGIEPALLDQDQTSGFNASIFTDGDGHYVLAFPGSDSTPDWLNNLAQGQGLPATQYAQAVQLATQVDRAFGKDGNLVITGHSLGGGLAGIASAQTGVAAVTFNAAGVHDDTMRMFGMNPEAVKQEAEDGQIRAYSMDGEFLSSLQDHRGLVFKLLMDGGSLASIVNPVLGGVVSGKALSSLLNGDLPKALGHRVTVDDPHPVEKPETHWYDWLWGNAEYHEIKYKVQQIQHALDKHGIGSVIEGLHADHPDWPQ